MAKAKPKSEIANRQITGAERERLTRQVVAKYKAGGTVRSIAAEIGRSYGFTHRLLADSPEGLRQRGGNRRQRKAPLRDAGR